MSVFTRILEVCFAGASVFSSPLPSIKVDVGQTFSTRALFALTEDHFFGVYCPVNSALTKPEVWDEISTLLERRLNKHIFDSWFRPIRFEGVDEETLTLHLRAGQVTIDWVSLYYSQVLSQTMSEAGLSDYAIEWSVDATAEKPDTRDEEGEADLVFEIQKPAMAAAAAVSMARPAATNFVDIEPVESSLNPKYTFEKFVVGASNQFAHAASQAVAESPGKAYNPLFLYGGVGLGKTHLMHAVGHAIKPPARFLHHKRKVHERVDQCDPLRQDAVVP